jgi:hypothetical protein
LSSPILKQKTNINSITADQFTNLRNEVNTFLEELPASLTELKNIVALDFTKAKNTFSTEIDVAIKDLEEITMQE